MQGLGKEGLPKRAFSFTKEKYGGGILVDRRKRKQLHAPSPATFAPFCGKISQVFSLFWLFLSGSMHSQRKKHVIPAVVIGNMVLARSKPDPR
jgi:hypothetical protein